MDLSDQEIKRLADALAPRLVEQVRASHNEFWIDPQKHYDAHSSLDDLLSDYKSAKGIFMKIFLTGIALSAIVLAAWSILFGFKR